MIETYIHLSPVEQDRVMLKHAGLITDEENRAKERRVSGKICQVCHTQNSPTSRYCAGCGTGLTDEEAMKQEVLIRYLQKPEVMREMFDLMLKSQY